jgi:hypothetical protein
LEFVRIPLPPAIRYDLLGQLQPLAQSSQHSQSHPQSGQPSQQSSEQQLPPSQQPPAAEVADGDAFAPARNKPETIAREPNNLVNI